MGKNSHWTRYYPLYVLSLLTMLFFAPLLLFDQMYYYRDFFMICYGDKKFLADSYQQWQWPLWTPYRFCGLPFLANIPTGCFDPFNLLLVLLPFHLGFKLTFVASLYLAGAGTYWLLRLWQLRRLTALIGATNFMLSGVVLSGLSSPIYLVTHAWIPVIFAAFHTTLAKKSWRWLLLTGMFAAFQFFAGHPQCFIVTCCLLLPYGLLIGDDGWQPRLQRSAIVAATLAILISALGAAQLLPGWELMQLSSRHGGLPYAESSKWSLTPLQFLQMLCPGLQGHAPRLWYGIDLETMQTDAPFFPAVYMSAAGFLLLCTGLFLPGNRLKWFSLITSAIFAAVAFGFYLPFYYLVWKYVPVLGSFRYPEKYLIFSHFFAVVVMAINFETLFYQWQRVWPACRTRILAGVALACFAYAAVVGFVLLPPAWQNCLPNLVHQKLPHIPVRLSPHAWLQVACVGAIIGGCLLAWGGMIRARRKTLACLLLVAMGGQMLHEGWAINPTCSQKIYTDRSWSEKLLQGIGQHRYYNSFPQFHYHAERKAASIDIASYAALVFTSHNKGKLQNVCGYDAFMLERMSLLTTHYSLHQLLDLGGARYLLIQNPKAKDWQRYRQLARHGEVTLFENDNCLPRAWFPAQVLFVPNTQAAVEEVKRWKYVTTTYPAVVEGVPSLAGDTFHMEEYAEQDATADIVSYDNCQVEIVTRTTQTRWLVLSDTFYPGWQCTIDGDDAAIYPANLNFRAVCVPPGQHRLVMTFRSRSFVIGCWISALAWLACVLALCFGLLLRAKVRQ